MCRCQSSEAGLIEKIYCCSAWRADQNQRPCYAALIKPRVWKVPVPDEKETDGCVRNIKSFKKKNAQEWMKPLFDSVFIKHFDLKSPSSLEHLCCSFNGRFKEWYFSEKCRFNPIRLHLTSKPCRINQPSTNFLCCFQNYIIIKQYTNKPLFT